MTGLALVYLWIAFALAAHVLFHLWARLIAPARGWFGLFMPVRAALALHALGTAAFYLVPPSFVWLARAVQLAGFSLSAFTMTLATRWLVGQHRAWSLIAAAGGVCLLILSLTRYRHAGAVLPWSAGFVLLVVWLPFMVASLRVVRVRGYELVPGLGALFGAVAGLHDIAVRCGALDTPLALDFASLLTALVVAARLGGRVTSARFAAAEKQAVLEGNLRELEATRRELTRKRALAKSGEFAAIVAHEVRNPLAIIRNVGSRLADADRPPAERESLLSIAHEEVARLEALVEDLAHFATPLAPACQAVAIGPLLDSAAERERSARAGRRDLEFQVEVDPGLPQVRADPELLLMALGNLITNAIHALPHGGRIRLRAAVVGDDLVQVSVADNGTGMPADVLAQANQAFYTTRAMGTGLGLTIVERVAGAHGGRMEIDSDGSGTTVRLTLPITGPAQLAS